MEKGKLHENERCFFAPRADCPERPVTIEQKKPGPSPIMASTSIHAGEDDRTPPSQECGPRPGKSNKETTRTRKAKQPKLVKKGLKLYNWAKNAGRTQRLTSEKRHYGITNPSQQGKRGDSRLHGETKL